MTRCRFSITIRSMNDRGRKQIEPIMVHDFDRKGNAQNQANTYKKLNALPSTNSLQPKSIYIFNSWVITWILINLWRFDFLKRNKYGGSKPDGSPRSLWYPPRFQGFLHYREWIILLPVFFYNVSFIFFSNYKSHYTLEIMWACINVWYNGLNIIK